jgi:hypothetical protein
VDNTTVKELQDVQDKLIEVESQRESKWRQDAAVLQVKHDRLVLEVQPAKMQLQQLQQLIETYEHRASAWYTMIDRKSMLLQLNGGKSTKRQQMY